MLGAEPIWEVAAGSARSGRDLRTRPECNITARSMEPRPDPSPESSETPAAQASGRPRTTGQLCGSTRASAQVAFCDGLKVRLANFRERSQGRDVGCVLGGRSGGSRANFGRLRVGFGRSRPNSSNVGRHRATCGRSLRPKLDLTRHIWSSHIWHGVRSDWFRPMLEHTRPMSAGVGPEPAKCGPVLTNLRPSAARPDLGSLNFGQRRPSRRNNAVASFSPWGAVPQS